MQGKGQQFGHSPSRSLIEGMQVDSLLNRQEGGVIKWWQVVASGGKWRLLPQRFAESALISPSISSLNTYNNGSCL